MAETITILPNGNLNISNFFVPFIDTSRTEVIKIWKPINGFEGFYEVSNYGEVRSLDRWIYMGATRRRFKAGRIMNSPVGRSKYREVILFREGSRKALLLHRLVATHFISNPFKKVLVNHKNGNKLDCAAWNLEWATHSENNKHAYDIGLKVGAWKGKCGKNHKNSKPLLQLDGSGKILREWECASVAGRELRIRSCGIREVALGLSKTFKGFIWKYK